MAVIDSAPDDFTVRAARGVLDYACWRGVYYVRSWPALRRSPMSAAQQASANAFGAVAQAAAQTDPNLQAAWQYTGGLLYTWKDTLTAAMYGNLWLGEEPV